MEELQDSGATKSSNGDRPTLTPIDSPSRTNKLLRLLWLIVWTVLARWTPIPLHAWRVALARAFGARIGKGVSLYPSVSIWAPWNLIMDDGSCLAEGVRCYNVAPIDLGASSVVSQYSYLCAASHDPHDANFPLIGGPIRIGKGAWVAADAFVSPGIEIGDYAVVAARAVAVRHVRRHMIVGGNPAKVIGHRNSPDKDQKRG